MIENFATLTSNKPQVVVIGRSYVRKEEFFDNPYKSSSLGIYKVSELGPLISWEESYIIEKLVYLPFDEVHNIVIPYLHQ